MSVVVMNKVKLWSRVHVINTCALQRKTSVNLSQAAGSIKFIEFAAIAFFQNLKRVSLVNLQWKTSLLEDNIVAPFYADC